MKILSSLFCATAYRVHFKPSGNNLLCPEMQVGQHAYPFVPPNLPLQLQNKTRPLTFPGQTASVLPAHARTTGEAPP